MLLNYTVHACKHVLTAHIHNYIHILQKLLSANNNFTKEGLPTLSPLTLLLIH